MHIEIETGSLTQELVAVRSTFADSASPEKLGPYFSRMSELPVHNNEVARRESTEGRQAAANISFTGELPGFYDRHLGPAIFEPYAVYLAERVARLATGAVLEVGCGTGIVTQRLREALPESVPLVSTDLDHWMLAYAKSKVTASGIEWQQADVTAVQFPDQFFSVVTGQFVVMFVDKDAAAKEVRRVLRPGGKLIYSYWDNQSINVFARIAHQTVCQLFEGNPPEFYNIAFGGRDKDEIFRRLTATGFSNVSIEDVPLELHAESARSFATGLISGMPVSTVMKERGIPVAIAVDRIEAQLAEIGGAVPFRSPMRAVFVTADAA
jgi:SAM-dependent methyltransferase